MRNWCGSFTTGSWPASTVRRFVIWDGRTVRRAGSHVRLRYCEPDLHSHCRWSIWQPCGDEPVVVSPTLPQRDLAVAVAISKTVAPDRGEAVDVVGGRERKQCGVRGWI